MGHHGSQDRQRKPSFSEQFLPKRVTVLSEGYGRAELRADALAGLTVAIDALVLGVTFFLVIFRDLTEGILVGFLLGAILFIRRMSESAHVEERAPLVDEDRADEVAHYDSGAATDSDVLVCRIKGAFFFGAASTVGSVLDRIADRPRAFVLDFAEVPFLDSTAAHSVELLARKMIRKGGRLYLTGTSAEIRRTLLSLGLREPKVGYAHAIEEAVTEARLHLS